MLHFIEDFYHATVDDFYTKGIKNDIFGLKIRAIPWGWSGALFSNINNYK